MRFAMRLKRFLAISIILFLCAGCTTFTHGPTTNHAEVYFSPDDHIRNRIIDAIDNSRISIDIAIFDFTSVDIETSLEKAKARGVKIRLIADSRQAKGEYSVIQLLIDKGFDVKVIHGKGRGIMHNKFAIFDKSLLFTGSYNWTENAESFNYENAIFIRDPVIINQYQKEFDEIWNTHQ